MKNRYQILHQKSSPKKNLLKFHHQKKNIESNANKVVIAYQDRGTDGSDQGTVITGSVSGTSITFDTATEFDDSDVNSIGCTFDSNSKRVSIAYADQGNSTYGTGIIVTPAGTPEDLTIGQQYFVQTDGTLGTSADSPSVIAGTAIGASDIIVKG